MINICRKNQLIMYFFNCYLAVPQPTLGHSCGNSLTNWMLITSFVQFQPGGHQEPHIFLHADIHCRNLATETITFGWVWPHVHSHIHVLNSCGVLGWYGGTAWLEIFIICKGY